ncbi:MAG: hypothetical protein ACREPT_04785 [Rudaea sp.]
MSRRRRRKEDIRHRVANPFDEYDHCRVVGCGQRTMASRRRGLNRLYCKRHTDHYRRHGSYVNRSYGAGDLRPYRVRALRWLKAHRDDHAVQLAANAVLRLYRSAGAHVEAFRLTGKPPQERARATWAQLRQRRVDPLEVLAIWLAVDARLRDDPQADRHDEYRLVQVAKLVHRAAGGAHKRWEQERSDGRVKVVELHVHPASRGRVLRVIGLAVAKACEGLVATGA